MYKLSPVEMINIFENMSYKEIVMLCSLSKSLRRVKNDPLVSNFLENNKKPLFKITTKGSFLKNTIEDFEFVIDDGEFESVVDLYLHGENYFSIATFSLDCYREYIENGITTIAGDESNGIYIAYNNNYVWFDGKSTVYYKMEDEHGSILSISIHKKLFLILLNGLLAISNMSPEIRYNNIFYITKDGTISWSNYILGKDI